MELYSRSRRGKSMVRKRGTLGRKYRTYKLFRCCIIASCVQPLTLPTAAVHGLAHRGQDPNSAAHPCAYHCGKGAQSCFRWSRDWLPIRCKSSATYLLSQRFKSPADFMQSTSGQCHNLPPPFFPPYVITWTASVIGGYLNSCCSSACTKIHFTLQVQDPWNPISVIGVCSSSSAWNVDGRTSLRSKRGTAMVVIAKTKTVGHGESGHLRNLQSVIGGHRHSRSEYPTPPARKHVVRST